MESSKLEISEIVVVQSIDLFKRTKFKIKCIFFQKILLNLSITLVCFSDTLS